MQATEIAPNEIETLISGALYDFLGFLTSRNEEITLSAHHEAGVAVQALTGWAEKRGLNIASADVQHWQESIKKDAMWGVTLLSELGQISAQLARATIADQHEALRLDLDAQTRLDQLRVRISRDVSDMQAQEAADDSEMPLGPIAARAHRIEDEVAF